MSLNISRLTEPDLVVLGSTEQYWAVLTKKPVLKLEVLFTT